MPKMTCDPIMGMHDISATQLAERDFVILGAGAIGSILGAHLARAGYRVAMIARGSRAEQIRSEGLRISGIADICQVVPTLLSGSELRSAKVLIIAMKALHTRDALITLRHAHIGTAFSIQNGVLKDELLAEIFGPQCVLGAVANISGELLQGGEVMFTRNVNLLLGELDGQVSTRALAIARAIDAAGVRATVTKDIGNLTWSKFVGWVGLAVLALTTRAVTGQFLSDPNSALVFVRLIREMGDLARICGIELTDESIVPVASVYRCADKDAIHLVRQIGQHFSDSARSHRVSSLQDLEAGRPLELYETLGWALRRAEQAGLKTPQLSSYYARLGDSRNVGVPGEH